MNSTAPKMVTTDWMADRLDDPGVRIVEVDEDTDACHRGHVLVRAA